MRQKIKAFLIFKSEIDILLSKLLNIYTAKIDKQKNKKRPNLGTGEFKNHKTIDKIINIKIIKK